MSAKILIVDDEPRMGAAMSVALSRVGHTCEVTTDGLLALEAYRAKGADVVVTDWRMPGLNGLELLKRLRALDPELPVILVTAHGDVPSAVAAMREGAFDYVTKPFDNDELRALVDRAFALRSLARENETLRAQLCERHAQRFVAESPAMKKVVDLVRRVAPTSASVIIEGETGTGKEVVAKLLHFFGDRVGKPFVAVNCKAFAAGVLESELFGHAKGAFTGADVARAGCFERAHGGTLFLDEIGEIDFGFQAKLLRVIQEREVLPVGATTPRPVDVRIVTATHRDLLRAVDDGTFREDLYFRLNVIKVQLPPLRERPEDVLPLARHFMAAQAHETGRALALSGGAEAALVAHPWRGNVRELENALQRAAVLARGANVEPEDLLLEGRSDPRASDSDGAVETGTLQACLDRAAERRIRAALQETEGRRAEAAEALGVDRTTLYRLMKRLGL